MNIPSSELLNLIQGAANLSKEHLVGLTKVFNEVAGTTLTDKFMDEAVGRGHRIVHGHSPEYLVEIVQKYGFEALPDAFAHWIRDFMSPDGVPFLPYTKKISEALGLSPTQTIDWLSLNIGDALSGGLSAYHSYELAKAVIQAVDDGYLPKSRFTGAIIGASIKIISSAASPNPVSMTSGMIDLGFIIWTLTQGVQIGAPALALQMPPSVGKSAFWSGSAAACTSYVGARINKRSFNFKKEFISGAIGGACGYGISVGITTNPIGISAAAIGGYILARDIYQYFEEFDDTFNDSYSPIPSI